MRALEAEYALHPLCRVADKDAEIVRIAPRVRGIVTGSAIPPPRTLIERFPRVEIIACFGLVLDSIDVAYARSRGSVVDEPALVEALERRSIRAAGLDVFADEPCVPPALMALDNVVLQPHKSSATHETRTAMAELVLANLRAHFAGQPVPTPVA